MVLVGTGIAPPGTHPVIPPPRVHPPSHCTVTGLLGLAVPGNMVVGLRSVGQLSLSGHFSDNRDMTEVYNLRIAGNPDDHYCISGTD